MSLGGPRPLLGQYLPLYSDSQVRQHKVRLSVTGWAQVNGRNSTMASWIIRLAIKLQPVINLLHETQLSGFYLQLDETSLKVLREPGMKPQGHK